MESGQYSFNEDIKTGEAGEVIVQNYLKANGCTIVTDNKDFKYDFIATTTAPSYDDRKPQFLEILQSVKER